MSSETAAEIPVPLATDATVEQHQENIKKRRVAPLPPKAQKKIDALEAKIEKLLNDNRGLKKQLQEIKSAHSRIRRIPRPQQQQPAETQQ